MTEPLPREPEWPPADPELPSADPELRPGSAEPAPSVAEQPAASYDLPGARRVVGAGLQLATGAAADLRRASIYIGLLVLAAFGPAVVFLILTIERFDVDLGLVLDALVIEDDAYLLSYPEVAGALLFVMFLAVVGLLLLFVISIDAQVIAVAILAGQAATRPVRLREAIWRARQVFWRMVAGGLLVGVYTTTIQFVLVLILTGGEPNLALEFVVAMIATIATVPFAYLATGIVLGDVGPSEALARSIRLFRARPTVALVVVLFTLVTSAIEVFALGAGLDVVDRIGSGLRLDATAGGIGTGLTILLSLAVVTAFGSLLFTIAALVSAPQVAAFLGLTFYAGGLERVRVDGERPPRFRWVTRPMQLVIGLLVVAAVLGVPTVMSAPGPGDPQTAQGPLIAILRDAAAKAGDELTMFGAVVSSADPAGDEEGRDDPIVDLVTAEYVMLERVPDWLLEGLFVCGRTTSVCGSPDDERWPYEAGALLFLQRMAAPATVTDLGVRGYWGPLLVLDGFDVAPPVYAPYLRGVSHSVLTRVSGGVATIRYSAFDAGSFGEYWTYARSAWIGSDLLTLIPVIDLPGQPLSWDIHAATDAGSRDALRSDDGGDLRPFELPARIGFDTPATEEPGG